MNVTEAQTEIDAVMDKLAENVIVSVYEEADSVVDKIDRIRFQINGILSDYAKKDGTIPKHRIGTLLHELDEIEDELASELAREIERILAEIAEETDKNLIGVLIALFGAALLFGSAKNRPVLTNMLNDFLNDVFDREINGTNLRNILLATAGYFRDTMQREIRNGAYRNWTIHRISLRIKEEFERLSYTIKRIITTEIPIAFRRIIATMGGRLRIVKAVKIIDTPGRLAHPRTHDRHECYRLAEQNPYGWGKGVYRPQDTYIFDPHPQCTAYFRYILDEEAFNNANE